MLARRKITLGLMLLLAGALMGCGDIIASIANAPTYFGDLKRNADIAYGPGPEQKLDIYTSSAWPQGTTHPVVLFIHGGRWSYGHKEQYRFIADPLVRAGFMVVIPDYLKYPQVKFPALMEDPARAAAWVGQHIVLYGGDSSKLYLMGHSSGAHVGALLISDTHYLKKYGSSPTIFRAFVGLAGPYDFIPSAPDLEDIFGPPDHYPLMQVPTYITGHEPPMFLLYGTEDNIVEPYNISLLADAIRKKHGEVVTRIYPGVGHFTIISSFAKDGPNLPVPDDCIAFFRTHGALAEDRK